MHLEIYIGAFGAETPPPGLELVGRSTSKLNDNPNDIPNDNLKITSKLNDSQMIARVIS